MNLFKQHLKNVNESYFQHMRTALGFSSKMALASIMCLIHALFPFIFENSASAVIKELNVNMGEKRHSTKLN